MKISFTQQQYLPDVAAAITAAALINPLQQANISERIAKLTGKDAPNAFATVAAEYYQAVVEKLRETGINWEEEPETHTRTSAA